MAKKRSLSPDQPMKRDIGRICAWSLIVVLLALGGLLASGVVVGMLKWHEEQTTPAQVQTDPYSGVLIVEMDDGQGSCFVVAEQDGWWYAITAAHVVEAPLWAMYGEPDYSPSFTVDDEQYEVEVVRVSNDEDVALIRFQSSETYTIYSFGSVEVGDICYTVGYSRGAKLVYRGYVVTLDFGGHIAANGGVVPGCSGGVLLNAEGEAVGITVALPVYSGMGFDSTAMYEPIRYAEAMLIAEGIR